MAFFHMATIGMQTAIDYAKIQEYVFVHMGFGACHYAEFLEPSFCC